MKLIKIWTRNVPGKITLSFGNTYKFISFHFFPKKKSDHYWGHDKNQYGLYGLGSFLLISFGYRK